MPVDSFAINFYVAKMAAEAEIKAIKDIKAGKDEKAELDPAAHQQELDKLLSIEKRQ